MRLILRQAQDDDCFCREPLGQRRESPEADPSASLRMTIVFVGSLGAAEGITGG